MFDPPQGIDYGLSDDFLDETHVPLDAMLGLTEIKKGLGTDDSRAKIDALVKWLEQRLRSVFFRQDYKFFAEVLQELEIESSTCESVRAELEQIVRELVSIATWGKGDIERMHKFCDALSSHCNAAAWLAIRSRRSHLGGTQNLTQDLLSDIRL